MHRRPPLRDARSVGAVSVHKGRGPMRLRLSCGESAGRPVPTVAPTADPLGAAVAEAAAKVHARLMLIEADDEAPISS